MFYVYAGNEMNTLGHRHQASGLLKALSYVAGRTFTDMNGTK